MPLKDGCCIDGRVLVSTTRKATQIKAKTASELKTKLNNLDNFHERGRKDKKRCGCCNKECHGNGICYNYPEFELYRVDMDGGSVAMCETCAEDAVENGLFTEEEQ